MKNIYFVEAGFSFDNDVYLPYATGTIAAYLKQKGCFDEKFNLAGFFFRREQTDSIIERIDEPYIVGFSCCIWNQEFNLVLAEKIKNKYPECTVVFGGHNITVNDNLLKKYPFIDILIFGEGEKTFCELLSSLENGNLKDVDNISFRRNGTVFLTPAAPPCAPSDFPSPYLSGIFDGILSKEDHSHLLCVLETNRGCPYSCSYCDWCAGRSVRKFPTEKVFAEIEWFAKQKIEYCFCADSNFGIFDRDIEIARFAAETKKKYGFPKVFRTCFAKESNENVFRISGILNDAGMDKGATMAYQTLSETALKNINRKNLTLEHFSSLLKKYNEAGIPTYSELILGLPGETRESFCRGICRILESGQHNSLSIYYLELLPNSEMAQPSYIAKHKLGSVRIEFNHMHSIKKDTEINEYSHIVQSTATLSKDDWVYCNLFSVCVQCFHSLGYLRCIAMYLNNEKNISYYDFYSSLTNYILTAENTEISRLFSLFKERLSSSLSGEWNYTSPDFGEIAWAFEEGAYLNLIKNSDKMMAELDIFLSAYFDNKTLYSQLKEYQQAVLRSCGKNNEQHSFDFDFLSFFDRINQGKKAKLEKERAVYTFSAENNFSSWKDFAKEIVWFGRRRGDTFFSNRPNAKTKIQKTLI